MHQLLEWLALPQFGLSTVFVVSFVSATLLPLGSEPAVFGLIKLNPDLFWPAILVATVGNTLGGSVSWWMGLGAHKAVDKARGSATEVQALNWLKRFGARACLLSLEGKFKGHEAFYIVAPDTTADLPSLEVAAKLFPGIPIKGDLSGRKAFFNSSKAERILGWKHDL